MLDIPNIQMPHKAFWIPKKLLEEEWKSIPKDIDILVTHTPPYGILD